MQNYPLYKKNINYLLNLPQKDKYDKTTKYAISSIGEKKIYITEFLFAKQRGYIKELRGHGEIDINYYKLLPFIFKYYQTKYFDTKSKRFIYMIDDNDGRKISHVLDDDGFLISIYLLRKNELKRFLKKAQLLYTNPDGEAPISPILSPARATFWRHLEMIEQLYQIFTSKPIYLFSISAHPHAISVNSLDITFFKPNIDFFKYDYLIITSKQTSEALKQYDKNDYIHMPSLCVSVASAKSYEELGGNILDIGGGYGDNLVDKIKSYPKTTKWLYLRAKVVASDFVSTCQNDGYDVDEIVVYESGCSKAIWNVEVKEDAILIFTSPSSVKCFLKNHTISPHAKVIVIGKTTAKALPKDVEYVISDKTSIQSCIEITKNL